MYEVSLSGATNYCHNNDVLLTGATKNCCNIVMHEELQTNKCHNYYGVVPGATNNSH